MATNIILKAVLLMSALTTSKLASLNFHKSCKFAFAKPVCKGLEELLETSKPKLAAVGNL